MPLTCTIPSFSCFSAKSFLITLTCLPSPQVSEWAVAWHQLWELVYPKDDILINPFVLEPGMGLFEKSCRDMKASLESPFLPTTDEKMWILWIINENAKSFIYIEWACHTHRDISRYSYSYLHSRSFVHNGCGIASLIFLFRFLSWLSLTLRWCFWLDSLLRDVRMISIKSKICEYERREEEEEVLIKAMERFTCDN